MVGDRYGGDVQGAADEARDVQGAGFSTHQANPRGIDNNNNRIVTKWNGSLLNELHPHQISRQNINKCESY